MLDLSERVILTLPKQLFVKSSDRRQLDHGCILKTGESNCKELSVPFHLEVCTHAAETMVIIGGRLEASVGRYFHCRCGLLAGEVQVMSDYTYSDKMVAKGIRLASNSSFFSL